MTKMKQACPFGPRHVVPRMFTRAKDSRGLQALVAAQFHVLIALPVTQATARIVDQTQPLPSMAKLITSGL